MTEYQFVFEFHGNPKSPSPNRFVTYAETLDVATKRVKELFPYRLFRMTRCTELCEACE
jgi:hypothetical protein